MNIEPQKTPSAHFSENLHQIRVTTWVGLCVNLGLTAFKFVGGILGHSHAVFADAIHSLGDSITDIVVLIGSRYWEEPPDESHPYGHRRIETLVTILIGFSLALIGIRLGLDAIDSLHKSNSQNPQPIAAWAAATSILVKEILFRWTFSVGKKTRSQVLKANAWHHRSDAFSSIPALIAAIVPIFLPNTKYVDDIGAFLVASLILWTSWKIAWPGISEMLDFAAPEKTTQELIKTALNIPGVLEVHDIRTRLSGSKIQADIHIVVDANISVQEGHDIAEKVMNTCLEQEDVFDVLVHVDPSDDSKLNRWTH